ncbi:MAG: type I glyceraldehyde-3-phosphate dehydrogenase [Thermodesulfobacteriota bacterium]
MALGINGLGRIGKLTVWHHAIRRSFRELVVNVGREVGRGLEDVADYIVRDSTYGPLDRFLFGFRGGRVIEEMDESEGTMLVNGVKLRLLRQSRNPKDIPWRQHGVSLVVDCTGAFTDPTTPADSPKGSLRGHLEAGARKVILSAPFKIKDKSMPMPEDAVTTIEGINEDDYVATRHQLVSTASCTTTCLAFMMKPILDHFGPEPLLTASMVTVHAATGSQEVLDRLPDAKGKDLRKNRSTFNNIILTTTGAAEALGLVMPEMRNIGFMAESVRIPSNTGSLVILVLNLQDEDPASPIRRDLVNSIYRRAADGYLSRYLAYSDKQNVSADVIGTAAAAIIEGRETHTRTANLRVNLRTVCAIPHESLRSLDQSTLEVPITQVVVYGWYDNELGSYTHMLGERTIGIAKSML